MWRGTMVKKDLLSGFAWHERYTPSQPTVNH
jgi:hypothetical protein